MNEDKVFNAVDPNGVHDGDIMAFHFYVKVKKVQDYQGDVQIVVQNLEADQEFTVTGDALIAKGMSGQWFKEELSLSRTKIIGILKDSPNRPITMEFTKKDGSKRVMTFRYLSNTDTGYALVEELTEKGPEKKQVDMRTFEWMIVDGTKYIVKK